MIHRKFLEKIIPRPILIHISGLLDVFISIPNAASLIPSVIFIPPTAHTFTWKVETIGD
jgi:hypothetical protein